MRRRRWPTAKPTIMGGSRSISGPPFPALMEWWRLGRALQPGIEVLGAPQFTVGDLLPHLAGDQAKKTMGSIVSAEQLNLFRQPWHRRGLVQ